MSMVWIAYRLPEAAARDLLGNEAELEAMLESEDAAPFVDLDKSWHGLHWLFTGSAEPTPDVSSEVICGGTPIGDDLGYGPPHLLGAARVTVVAGFLADLDIAELRARFDPASMAAAQIYPAIWDEDDVFDSYLAPSLDTLKSFYGAASQAGEGVIQILS